MIVKKKNEKENKYGFYIKKKKKKKRKASIKRQIYDRLTKTICLIKDKRNLR